MEALTTEDTKKMKEMLYQRNLILDFDKDNEKELLKLKSEVETTLKEKRTETNKKLSVGDVQMKEIQESLFSKEEILNEKMVTQYQLFEWGSECRKLQHKIDQQKYDDQIKLAKVKMQIEKEYEEQLDKFKHQAQSDAQRSKLLYRLTMQISWRLKARFTRKTSD